MIAAKKYVSPAHSLSAALGFTEAELKQNRDGFLSGLQRSVLLSTSQRHWITMIVISIALALPAWSALQTLRLDVLSSNLLLLFICISLEIVAYALLIMPDSSLRQDAKAMRAASVQGRVHLDVVHYFGSGVSFSMSINGMYFGITQVTFMAFKNDEPYAVYFAPRSHRLLSAEWLREV